MTVPFWIHILPSFPVSDVNSLVNLSVEVLEEKKEDIWLSPMTKAPTPTEMSKGQSDNANNATKKFD